ncbi:MAG: TRAP transporter large permease subunit [Gammaproteobacteria bacterium]
MVIALILLALALLGVPLFAVIGLGALLAWAGIGVDLQVIAIELFRLAEMPVLVAIPLFTFAGYLLSESGAPGRLVRLTDALLGWMPGGLAFVALAACALFTAFTGATGVTIIALGALLYPALREAGYPERFSLGLVTTSGSLGLLFAPSLPLILYGVVVQQLQVGQPVSVDELFRAGLVPGLLMVVLLAGYGLWVTRGTVQRSRGFDRTLVLAAVRESVWEIPLPFVILGGIYGGYFAVSEAAAMTALWVLAVELLIRREVPLARLPSVLRESMVLVGGILVILGLSMASTSYLIDAGVPQQLFETVQGLVSDRTTFLLLLTIFLLIVGTMLDVFSATVLIVPLVAPVALAYGIHPAHLGILFLANMQLGYMTPPVGLNLFIAAYRFEQPIHTVFRAALPFFLLLLAATLLITFWPALSLWLID